MSFIQKREAKKAASFATEVKYPLDTFPRRHIGQDDFQTKEMLKRLKLTSLEDLTNKALPRSIRLTKPFRLPGDNTIKGEHEVLSDLRNIMDKNLVGSTCL